MVIDKVIVTNTAALKEKYGADFDVADLLRPLIRADERRGLDTRLVDLHDRKQMRDVAGTPVRRASDFRQNKAAIDAVFARHRPHYLMILGSIDVVPHQDLENPTPEDQDALAVGDLPYACEASYGRTASRFRGPTRVVGRVPDETGASDPSALVAALNTTARWRMRQRRAYDDYLGVSARVWRGSTALSLRNTFGSSAAMKLSPPGGPRWGRGLLERRMHFVNCHGAAADPRWFGQRGDEYPVAFDASLLAGRINDGTVATAECCYGAELYDPQDANGRPGICATYLREGAYGFFGSSTIAYGPADANGSADLICQYFLQRVLAGASIGRAALEARQRFIRNTSVLDPADLKTLAQFSLMGDPSIHPVRPVRSHTTPSGSTKAADVQAVGRAARRANLLANGLVLEESTSYAKEARAGGRRPRKALTALRERFKMQEAAVSTYTIERPRALAELKGKALPALPDTMHVLAAPLRSRAPEKQWRLVVASERNGEVVSVRELFSR